MPYEIVVTEIETLDDGNKLGVADHPRRIERLKQTVDDLDLEAVIKAVNGFMPRKRGPKRKAA